MLGNHIAAPVDQSLGNLGFHSGIVPGVGVHDLHGHIRVDALGAQIESSVAADHLGERVSRHIAKLVGLGLQAGSDTSQVTGFIDGSEVVVEVGETRRSCLITGCMAELDVGILSCYFLDIVLIAEAGCEDDVAARFSQLPQSGIALSTLRNIVLADDLIVTQAQGFLGISLVPSSWL